MKKTLNIDDQLLCEEKAAAGAETDTATVRMGLEALVQRAAMRRMMAYAESEPQAVDVPRRREAVARRRHQTA